MPVQELGIVAEQTAKREGAVARLSPGARHAAFPRLYAKPAALPTEASELRQRASRLTDEVAHLARENSTLRATVDRLIEAEKQREIEDISVSLPDRAYSFSEVISAYLKALETVGYTIDGGRVTLAHLKGPQKARDFAYARHVGIWLCRKFCLRMSYPALARALNYVDHTSTRHGFIHAPKVMAIRPQLSAAAHIVITKLEVHP